ncbi:hypothetical protein [Mycobacterium sp. D16Q16]|uniref:hypothetical protein n=1 Tax=Mycobacterium sp. D16Q16 TaxID=1855659 RepID=UPI00111731D8|nr:hypothetical protein [Mycobacterium sp. D16Q16]
MMQRDMRCAVLGAACAIGFSPVAAALTVVAYRFPVPMTGYVSGPANIWAAMFGAVFYLVLGGFAVIGGFGAGAGLLAERLRPHHAVPYTVGASFVVALLGALSLALLEHVVGVW